MIVKEVANVDLDTFFFISSVIYEIAKMQKRWILDSRAVLLCGRDIIHQ